MTRIVKIKTILWFLCGWAAVVTVFRFAMGMGATTALSDKTPWGFWIGFDVVSGVALAAGGFLVAAAVYIFHNEKFHFIARPAVLTAFLGYGAVVAGLMFDLGLPWNIWHPMIMWNPHSALFEVAWCVMLYFTVLALEFSPVLFENSKYQSIYKLLKKMTIPLVILGISLSMLHQSSLGTLFVIMPHRINPLFYSPIQNINFLLSAMALGIMMVAFEHHFTSWAYEHKPRREAFASFLKAGPIIIGIYLAVKLGDLLVRGVLPGALNGGPETWLFLTEIILGCALPGILLLLPGVRNSAAGQAVCSMFGIFGVVLNRVNVSGLSMVITTNTMYKPSWMEFSVSIGIVAAVALVFFFLMDNFPVHEEEHEKADESVDETLAVPVTFALPSFDKSTGVWMGTSMHAAISRYSLAFIIAAALCFSVLPKSAIRGLARSLTTPVQRPKLDGNMFRMDGDGKGRFVMFNHENHKKLAGGEKKCSTCHHANKPSEKTTPCHECHADMYIESDIFKHEMHQKKLGGNESCGECHQPGVPKTQMNTPCFKCHKDMFAKDPQAVRVTAPSYKDAMHNMCIPCHKKNAAEYNKVNLGVCSTCHKE